MLGFFFWTIPDFCGKGEWVAGVGVAVAPDEGGKEGEGRAEELETKGRRFTRSVSGQLHGPLLQAVLGHLQDA